MYLNLNNKNMDFLSFFFSKIQRRYYNSYYIRLKHDINIYIYIYLSRRNFACAFLFFKYIFIEIMKHE
jgi:hypothetical protein